MAAPLIRARISHAALVVSLLLVSSACASNHEPVVPSLTLEQARTALEAVVAHVETPDVSTPVGTTSLNFFQRVLLEGPDRAPTPGLREIAASLDEADLPRACAMSGDLLRNTLVNRVMNHEGTDAVEFTRSEVRHHDPEELFLRGDGGDVLLMGSPVAVPRDDLGLQTDVVSRLWKNDALALMDIIYGLGNECVDAAREEPA
jgi:hypothetical protein